MIRDGVTRDGVTREAVIRDALTRDALTRDALTRDAMTRDAMTRDAMTRDGALQKTATRDGGVTREGAGGAADLVSVPLRPPLRSGALAPLRSGSPEVPSFRDLRGVTRR